MVIEFETDRIEIGKMILKAAQETNWTPGKTRMTEEDHEKVRQELRKMSNVVPLRKGFVIEI